MEKEKITIRNYRSIPYNNPLTFEVSEGITFILGVNNVGKSNILKLFYELSGIVHPLSFRFGGKNFGGSSFYAAVKNQRSKESTIIIQMQTLTGNYELKLSPGDNENSSVYIVETQKFPQGSSPGIFGSIFNRSMYIGSFRTPIFQTNATYYDITIGEGFIKTWDSWANGNNVGHRTKIRELKNELRELFGFEVFEISVTPDKKNLIVETDNGSFYLDELGGGIGHFILVLGNALIREPDFILIDEPENALHPKMQEMFVRTLASKAKKGLMATSHSIGLARSVADNIYSLNRASDGRLSLDKYGDHYKPSILNTINELGYSQFVELGGNNILLVEGRTDIKCFKEILRKYHIEQHFIIMDLGGANFISGESMDELRELKRLNAKSYNVIFDSEVEEEGQGLKERFESFKQNCLDLGFNVFPTEFHSTDNYIIQEAVSDVIGHSYKALEKYENLEKRDKTQKWGKSLNWKMFREMSKEDFAGTKLNEFIEKTLIPLTK